MLGFAVPQKWNSDNPLPVMGTDAVQPRSHLDTPKLGSGMGVRQPKFVTPPQTAAETRPSTVPPAVAQTVSTTGRTPTIPIDPLMVPVEPVVEIGPALTQLQGSVNHLMSALTPEQQTRLQQSGAFKQSVDNYEKALKPWGKLWVRICRVLGVLAAVAATIFGAGVGYQQFRGGNATKADIEDHLEVDLAPVKVQVKKNTDAIEGVQSGVTTLLNRGAAEARVEEAQQVADVYRQEHEEKITEWAATKAAGKTSRPKPQKRTELIQAELDVRREQKELLKVK